MSRQEELRKVLGNLKRGTIQPEQAADALEKMFAKIEKDLGKVKEGETGSNTTMESSIKVQYVGLTDTVKKIADESVDSLKRVFGNYSSLLNTQLQQTVNGTEELNRALSKTGENVMRSFNDFQGLSKLATEDTASLMSRSVENLLNVMTMDEIKPFITKTTIAFKENFKAVALMAPEAEERFLGLAATFEMMGVKTNQAATYFQDFSVVGGMLPDEVATASLEIQKIAEITNTDFPSAMSKFHELVVQQGYSKKQAIASLKELSVQSMKTGIDVTKLGDIFGKGMDNFSQLAPKVAELNSVFKLRLNPAAMTRMTAKQRSQYITNALKNSNVDLNSRLLQRQLSSVFGSEEAARKYLSSIRNTNSNTAAAVAATTKELDKVGKENIDASKAQEILQKRAISQLDPRRALELQQEGVAARTQIKAAGGAEGLENEVAANRQMRVKTQEELTELTKGTTITYARELVAQFQKVSATTGKGPIPGVDLGKLAGATQVSASMLQDLAKKSVEANEKRIGQLDGLIAAEKDETKKAQLVNERNSLANAQVAMAKLAADTTISDKESLNVKTSKLFIDIMNKLQGRPAGTKETPAQEGERIKKNAEQAGKMVAEESTRAFNKVTQTMNNLINALKAAPIVLKVNGKELAKATLGELSSD